MVLNLVFFRDFNLTMRFRVGTVKARKLGGGGRNERPKWLKSLFVTNSSIAVEWTRKGGTKAMLKLLFEQTCYNQKGVASKYLLIISRSEAC